MGWDISYHPFSEEEVCNIYFKALDDKNHYKDISAAFDMDDFYTDQFVIRLDEARCFDDSMSFNKGHGFYMAIVAGLLRRYWYVRGSAFSFLVEQDRMFEKYVADWKEIIPASYQKGGVKNQLTDNYCTGVFITHAALCQLRSDYNMNPQLKLAMDECFSHGRIDIFWRAVSFAVENNLGLLEASEIIEPNPLNLNETHSFSNLFHCEKEGVFLYAEVVADQIKRGFPGRAKELLQRKSALPKIQGA